VPKANFLNMADQQNQGTQGGTGNMGAGANQAGGAGMFDDNPFGMGAGGTGAPEPEDTTPANHQIGGLLPDVITLQLPLHALKFDEQKFLHLLAGSISLTKDEKKRIIDSLPRLKQSQVDELMRIFEEERAKFAELSAKHVDQLKKLESQHYADWKDLEIEQKASAKKEEDSAQADEIRKKLGL